jgi:copper chaperone CopZ
LGVDIPCSGHAPLISDELKKIDGVSSVQFSLPNVFDVKYDSSKASKQQILSLEVFKTYKATVLSESVQQDGQQYSQPSIDGCCGGGESCGSGCGCGSR